MSVLMLSGGYLCMRSAKIAEAIPGHHGLCRLYPPQLHEEYVSLKVLRCATRDDLGVALGDHGIIHVHNEPNWPASTAKQHSDAKVILNVHDVTSAKPGPFDPDEEAAYADADAFVFITDEQRDFCVRAGFAVEGKPHAILGNYASRSTIVEKPLLPHVGGVIYAGGVQSEGGYYDMTALAHALKDKLHIYPGVPMPEGYEEASIHKTVLEYRLLTHRMAQHDWGIVGVPDPAPGWLHAKPNKAYEYLMAGIPLIVLNVPPLKYLCDEGLGIYCTTVAQVKKAAKQNPKPYKKRVAEARYRYTMEYNIAPLKELYRELGEPC